MIDAEVCPACSQPNWYSNGDLNDLTQPDVEALLCWNCGRRFWLPGAVDVRETLGESMDFDGPHSVIIEQGAKTPNSAIVGEPVMRTVTIPIKEILDLVVCAEDYGHTNGVLLTTLAEWAGDVTDAEIHEHAAWYLTPKAKAQGYTKVDRDEAVERLTEWWEKYGPNRQKSK
jgi:hypothetical protein